MAITGYFFSSLNSNSHNAFVPKSSKRCKYSWAKCSEEYFDNSNYDVEEYNYNY